MNVVFPGQMKVSKLKLDELLLEEVLGTGSAATVYLGYHSKDLSQCFAVKVADSSTYGKGDYKAAEVIAEAQILSQLSHPHIIQLISHSTCGVLKVKRKIIGSNAVYNVLQLGEKGSFVDYLRKGGPFPEPIAKHFFRQLISGIEHLHGKGIVHRDIKLDNLLIGENFELLIADFGHATKIKLIGNDGFLSWSSTGTQCYNPPETREAFYRGKPVDIFMAGTVLFLFLTGVRPFHVANEDDQFYRFIANAAPTKFWLLHRRQNKVELSPEVVQLISSMMAFDPLQRPSVEDVARHEWVTMKPVASLKQVRAEIRKRRLLHLDSQ